MADDSRRNTRLGDHVESLRLDPLEGHSCLPTKNVDESLRHRQELNKLLAINPNYFGNLDNSPFTANLEIIQDTAFEEVSCVGFNPDTDVLEATVQVKLPTGYGGDLCSPGSTEWVRFHISYDEGTTWEDVGLGSFNAHDVPDSVDCHRDKTKPLVYTVAFPLNDAKRKRCSSPVLPLVRAILSWQVQPPVGQPHWNPIWGNHLDRHIQLRPRPSIFRDVVEHLEIDLKKVPEWYEKVLPLPIPEPDPAPFSLRAGGQGGQAGQGASTPVRHAVAGRACRRPASRTSPCCSPRPSSSRPSRSTWAT